MTPSYLPPVGWVSRWLPMAIGGRLSSLPGRRAKILPISSMVTVQPTSSQAAMNQRRTSASRSVSVSRLMPPLAWPPILAVSMIVPQSRTGSMPRLGAAGGRLMPRLSSCRDQSRPERVVRMLLPGGEGQAGFRRVHGDAAIHRADMGAQVAADAFRVDHLIAARAIDAQRGDRLVGGVLAGDVAQAAFDAEILVDPRQRFEVEVEVVPMDVVGHGAAVEILDAAHSLCRPSSCDSPSIMSSTMRKP